MEKRFTLIALGVCLIAGVVQATPIVDYFDYTGGQTDLRLKGAADGGWAGAWTGSGSSNCSDFIPTANLTYSDGYYLAPDNVGGGVGNGANTDFAGRNFATPFADQTVWISAIVLPTGGDILLSLDGIATSNFLGVRSGVAKLRYGGTDFGSKAVASNVTHLLLARIYTNSAGNDTVDFWVDPNLSGGEAGLGTTVSTQNNKDPYGASFTGIGLFVSGTNRLDSLRIGTSLAEVTTPEPATLVLLALGGIAALRRRA